MSGLPAISVVVPTHGRQRQVRHCVQSVARQRLPDGSAFEIIVVDDGSATPVTLDGADGAVRLLRQERSGPASARNAGARAARAPLVAFIDDDCEPAPGWLEALLEAAREAPGCAYGGPVVNQLPHNACAEASQLIVSFLREYHRDGRDTGRFFTSNNLAFDRQALLEAGGFDHHYTRAAAEDRELCDRWTDAGRRIVFVPGAVVGHAHAMTLGGFWRQHFEYGRGAWGFRHARAARSGRPVRLEPWTFYRDLLWYPVRERGLRGLALSSLVVVSQAANAIGFAAEAARARPGLLSRT